MSLFRVNRRAGVLSIAILIFAATKAFAAGAPMSPAQLALYQGADREKILIEGAKREGQFTLYTSHTWFRTFVKDFEKKYPFTKVSEWRNDSKNLIRKVLEEAKSGRVLVDVVETTADGMGVIKREGLFQEYFSPEARYYPNELKPRGKKRLLLSAGPGDLQQPGIQHQPDSAGHGPAPSQGSARSEMEGKDGDHQHIDRRSMDRQRPRYHGT